MDKGDTPASASSNAASSVASKPTCCWAAGKEGVHDERCSSQFQIKQHGCPFCKQKVHGIFGEENGEAESLKDQTICFACINKDAKQNC